jgi:phosphoribosylamine---glycine ligase
VEVMVIGGGGREHALAWRIARSPLVDALSFTHDNPGFPAGARRVQGDPVEDAARRGVGLVVVGPEGPLADGIVDRLQAAGVPAFGPTAAAARLESSKSWAKQFLVEEGLPTAAGTAHDELAGAHAAVRGPCVVKLDGLAAGKGVVVADDAAAAHAAVDRLWAGPGTRLVVEERLEGPELSILALCDGERALPLLPCRDHKRRFDGDQGPNTGGMGAVCPVPGVDDALVEEVRRRVLQPTVDGMARRGTPLRGVLYAGLMLTADGPKVLEFNTRFGDPECQPLMMMLDEDLVPLLQAAAAGRLPDRPLRWRGGAACCVVLVDGDYPGPTRGGAPIPPLPDGGDALQCFYAGARRDGDAVRVSGGRVLGLTAHGPSLGAARAAAYAALPSVAFPGAAWRTDIGGAP